MSDARGSFAGRLRDAGIALALGVALLLALEGLFRAIGAQEPALPDPAPGVFRIVALGGSTVQGVPDGAQGFVAQLERSLRALAPGRPLEVVNLARAGVGSRTVRATLRRALDPPPDLLVVLTGHNEFLEPDPTRLQRLRDGSRLAAQVGSWLERAPDPEPALPDRLPAVDPDGAEAQRRRDAFRENLAAIVARTREAGVPLLLVTAPSNLADWPPAFRRVEGAVEEATVAGIRGLLATGRPTEALVAVSEARVSRGDDAMLRFLEARALRASGLPGDAGERFLRARERDPVPRRAFEAFNDAIRSHDGSPGVRVVDVARRFAERADAGLVGFDLIGDNCHPTPLGHAIIAREITLAMREASLFLPKDTRIPSVQGFLSRLAASLGDPESRQRRHVRWLLSNAIYAMKTPFFQFEVSRDYLERARAIAPNDWRVHANLGTLALFAGDAEQGRRSLARAAALKGAPLDPDDRSLTPYLKEALALSADAAPRGAGGS